MPNSGGTLLLLVALGFMVLLFTRGRRQQRQATSVQQQVLPGAEVMTGSGMFGRVVEVLDGQVLLETAPGVTSRWDKRAIARVVTAPEPGALGSSHESPPTDASPEGGAPPGAV